MECPYCGQMSFKELHEHPYPYRREYPCKQDNNINKMINSLIKNVQKIYKYQCSCGYPFFVEVKTGYPTQIYKQGMYQYKG